MIWILTLNGCKACPLVNYSMCMLFQQTNADTACGFLEKTEAAHEDTTTTKTLSTRDLPMKTIGDLKQQKKWMHLNWAKLQGNEKTWHAKLWCVSTWSILSIPSKIYGHFNYIIQLGEKNSSKPSKQLGSDHGIAMNFRQFSQIFPMFFSPKTGAASRMGLPPWTRVLPPPGRLGRCAFFPRSAQCGWPRPKATSQWQWNHTHMFHVWNIYQHLPLHGAYGI